MVTLTDGRKITSKDFKGDSRTDLAIIVLQGKDYPYLEMGDSDAMRVSKAYVDGGPTYKRFRARSMGRANSIHKRTSHITIIVEGAGTAPRK